MGHLVRPGIQLTVAEVLLLEHHRNALGRSHDLLFDQRMDALLRRIRRERRVVTNDQVFALRGRKERDLLDRPRPIGDDSANGFCEVAEQLRDRG